LRKKAKRPRCATRDRAYGFLARAWRREPAAAARTRRTSVLGNEVCDCRLAAIVSGRAAPEQPHLQREPDAMTIAKDYRAGVLRPI
jgi:hypothetical protein